MSSRRPFRSCLRTCFGSSAWTGRGRKGRSWRRSSATASWPGRPSRSSPSWSRRCSTRLPSAGSRRPRARRRARARPAAARSRRPTCSSCSSACGREEMRSDSATLRLSTLRRLGGAEAIVRDHLDSALARLDDRQLDAAVAVLNQLVTPSGTKIAHRPADLAEYAQLPLGELEPVLGTLASERILRMVEASGSEPERWEIFHDVLAGPIAAWRSGWAVERERRAAARQRRRLLLLSTGAFAALAVVIAIAVFAFVQRSHARADARSAQARELAAGALAELPVNGQAALGEALRAARIAPSGQTETVLRTALIGSYERSVVEARRQRVFGDLQPRGQPSARCLDERWRSPARPQGARALDEAHQEPARGRPAHAGRSLGDRGGRRSGRRLERRRRSACSTGSRSHERSPASALSPALTARAGSCSSVFARVWRSSRSPTRAPPTRSVPGWQRRGRPSPYR